MNIEESDTHFHPNITMTVDIPSPRGEEKCEGNESDHVHEEVVCGD